MEYLNGCISQYNQIKEDLKLAIELRGNFKRVIEHLFQKYKCIIVDYSNEYAVFSFEVDSHEMRVCIYMNEDDKIVLSDTLEFKFCSHTASLRDCRISDLKNHNYINKLKAQFGKLFDKHIYVIKVRDMTGEVDYEDEITVYDYEDKNEVLTAARKLAKILNERYSQCFCITLHKGFKRLLSGDVAGGIIEYYTISTKSNGETMKARRKAGFQSLEVDEYIEIKPSNNQTMENNNAVVVMNIVKLDADGNLDVTLERYTSVEEAKNEAEEAIKEWLSENYYTLDENESESTDGYFSLCEREDYENLIEVRCTESIAEMNVLIKKFEV